MIIGIDIDDTITDSSELIFEYAKKHFKSKDAKVINDILYASDMEGKQLLDFYNKFLPEMVSKFKLKKNVRKVIDRLRKKGHKIIIITARGYTIKKGLHEATDKYFKKHKISVDKTIYQAVQKILPCVENKVDIMIDDSINVLKDVRTVGIETVLFTSIHNKDVDTDLERVASWLELENYINRMAN